MKLPLAEEKLENTIRSAPQDSFTFLCFIEGIRHLCPDDLGDLFERFGQFGQKRRYIVTKYLSNNLDVYSQTPGSLLRPFTWCSMGKFKDYNRSN